MITPPEGGDPIGVNFDWTNYVTYDNILHAWWIPTYHNSVRFIRDASGNIIGQTTNIYEYRFGYGWLHSSKEITTFTWKNGIGVSIH